MIEFMALIGFAAVFVMMSLGYSGKGNETEYHGDKIKTDMGYKTAKKLLKDIERDIDRLELQQIGTDLQIRHREYDREDEVSKKNVGKRLKKESRAIPENLEKLYDRKEELEEIIENYENIISNKAGDARRVFNPNPVPA